MRFVKITTLLIAFSSATFTAQAGLLNVWSNNNMQKFDTPLAPNILNNVYDRRNAFNGVRAYDQNGNVNRLTNDDNYGRKRQNQSFDAEYLMYKYDPSTRMLTLGLQTGFNLQTGVEHISSRASEYAGDLRISFGNGVEYAVDFGLMSKTTNGRRLVSGANDAGVYRTTAADWSTETYFDPGTKRWARTGGTKVADLNTNQVGHGVTQGYVKTGDNRYSLRSQRNYYRLVSFSLTEVLGNNFNFGNDFNMTAFWTMSCLNDHINGFTTLTGEPPTSNVTVNAPGTLALFVLSLAGLGWLRRKR